MRPSRRRAAAPGRSQKRRSGKHRFRLFAQSLRSAEKKAVSEIVIFTWIAPARQPFSSAETLNEIPRSSPLDFAKKLSRRRLGFPQLSPRSISTRSGAHCKISSWASLHSRSFERNQLIGIPPVARGTCQCGGTGINPTGRAGSIDAITCIATRLPARWRRCCRSV